jgi:hypothetical protein
LHRYQVVPQVNGQDLRLTGKRNWWSNCRSANAAPLLLKDIEGLVELGVISASKGLWINVHENVGLHA